MKKGVFLVIIVLLLVTSVSAEICVNDGGKDLRSEIKMINPTTGGSFNGSKMQVELIQVLGELKESKINGIKIEYSLNGGPLSSKVAVDELATLYGVYTINMKNTEDPADNILNQPDTTNGVLTVTTRASGHVNDPFCLIPFKLNQDPPTIKAIPDQTAPGTISLDLDNYFVDEGQKKTYTVVGAHEGVVVTSVNQNNGVLTITPNEVVSDVITYTVTANDGIHTVSNSFDLTVTGAVLSPESEPEPEPDNETNDNDTVVEPPESNSKPVVTQLTDPTPTLNFETTFAVGVVDVDNDDISIIWKVNDLVVQNGGEELLYTPQQEIVYTVSAEVSDGEETVVNTWTLDLTPTVEQQVVSVCGDGIQDSGEDCSSCPVDVSCLAGQSCVSGVCVSQPSPALVEPDDPPIIIIIGVVAVALIAIGVMYFLIYRRPKSPRIKPERPKPIQEPVRRSVSKPSKVKPQFPKEKSLEEQMRDIARRI